MLNLFSLKLPSTLWCLIIGIMLSRIGTSLTIPFLTLFLHKYMGLNFLSIGIIVASSFLAQMCGGFTGGILADIYGRHRLMGLAILCYACTFILFGSCAHLVASAVMITTIFCLLNIISGFARAWAETLAQTLLADYTTAEQKRVVFGLRYTAANLGTALGAPLGLVFGISGSYYSFYGTAIILFLYYLFFVLIIQTRPQPTLTTTEPANLKFAIQCLFNDKRLRQFVLAGALIYIAYVQQEALFVTIISTATGNMQLAILIISLNALLAILLPVPLAQCLKTYTPYQIVKWGAVMMAIGLVIIGNASTHVSLYIIGEFIFSIGEISIFPYFGVIVGNLAPAHLQGSYFGASTLQLCGRALGPVLSGLLIETYSIAIALAVIGLIALSSLYFIRACEKIR